jgi:hypothetical protein
MTQLCLDSGLTVVSKTIDKGVTTASNTTTVAASGITTSI